MSVLGGAAVVLVETPGTVPVLRSRKGAGGEHQDELCGDVDEPLAVSAVLPATG